MLVRDRNLLLKAITAFTIGHSLSLALATVGIITAPRAVEAVIALSVVFLVVEIARSRRGADALTARRPWLVAGGFGLVHGLGFSGALTTLHLPATEIPAALVAFNAGIETGQLAFLAVLAMAWECRRRLAASRQEKPCESPT